MHKRFILGVLLSSAVLLAAAGVFVYLIDPFFQYHKPLFGMKPLVNNESYQNPGIARNFDYDSVITGSSMTENMRASWYDELFGCKAVKLPFSGGRSKNYSILFDEVFRHGGIKNVFYGLDIYALTSDSKTTRNPLPDYLYNHNLLDDTNYVLNKTVLFNQSTAALEQNIKNRVPPLDEAYTWKKKFEFSKKAVLSGFKRRAAAQPMAADDALLAIYRENMDNLLPAIRNNPDTTFTIFFPPYSILYWDNEMRDGTADATFRILEQAVGELLSYQNVKVLYFQDAVDIVTNLDNYKDYTHFNVDISKYMAQSMADGRHRMTQDNYKQRLADFREYVKHYDFDSLFK